MNARHWGSDIKAGGGHAIATTGAGLRCAPDCPACKYGTIVPDDDDAMRCIDCKATFARRDLVRCGVLPNAAGEAFRKAGE